MKVNVSGTPADFAVRSVIIAGWTARDQAKVDAHIKELADIGVPPPSTTPLYYEVGANMLSTGGTIDVLGPHTSGEAEPVLTCQGGVLHIGLGSDHTDRDLETHSVPHSKQVCPKPVSDTFWPLDTVPDVEALHITADIEEGGALTRYQDGRVGAIRPLLSLWERSGAGEGDWLFCGTFAAIGAVRPARAYHLSMADPATGRTITLDYDVRVRRIIA
ncbi:MAG: DUF2848 family protein [Pseudomonadota bacterium]